MVPYRRQQVPQGFDLIPREWLEELLANYLDMAGEHFREPRAPGRGDRDGDAPFVVLGRGPRDQACLLEQSRLVGQAASAIDDTVRQIRHAMAARRRVPETRQQLELHVAEIPRLPQLLLDGVAKQARNLDQREVRAQLDVVKRWR